MMVILNLNIALKTIFKLRMRDFLWSDFVVRAVFRFIRLISWFLGVLRMFIANLNPLEYFVYSQTILVYCVRTNNSFLDVRVI